MAKKFNPGDTTFLVKSNRIIREVRILKFGGGFYTIRFADSDGGIKVKEHRLFSTKEEAEESLPRKKTTRSNWP